MEMKYVAVYKKDLALYTLAAIEVGLICVSDKLILDKIECCKDLLYVFIKYSALSFLFFLLLLVASVAYIRYISNKPIGRASHSVLYLVSSIFMMVEMFRHPINIPLFSLLAAMLFVTFITETSVLLDARYGIVKDLSKAKKGFVSDNKFIGTIENVGWDKFADNLIRRLVNTDTSKSAFAVALTGKWGTGKTTFIELMKKKLQKENVLMIDFNPWLSDSSKMIINDYFNSLKEVLGKDEVKIDKIIDKYVGLLVRWQFSSVFDKVYDYIGSTDYQGLQSIRNQISERLSLLGKSIYVFIDDTDRLQKEEILEVMKLIRNTADFTNMNYIVTFDKQYVLDALEKANISDASLYLKKIFRLELNFPIYEKYLLTHFLVSELAQYQHLQDGKLNEELGNLEMRIQEQDVYIKDYFNNFRDVKRFVNDFLLVIDYIEDQGMVRDFNLHDLFLVELIKYTDEKVYELLKDQPLEILFSIDKSEFFELNQNINNKVSSLTYKLLAAIFSHRVTLEKSLDLTEMRRKNKYYTYFSFRPFAFQMSITEFLSLLEIQDEEYVKSEIAKTRNGIFSKSDHLFDLMSSIRIRTMRIKAFSNYLIVLSEWTKLNLDFNKQQIVWLYKKILSSKIDKENSLLPIAKQLFSEIFKFLMNDMGKGVYLLQSILTSMMTGKIHYASQIYKSEINYGDSYYSSLIEKFNHRNIANFLDMVKPSIYSIYEDSRLHAFIQASAIYTKETMPSRPLFSSVEAELIEYFSNTKSENDYRKFFERFHFVEPTYDAEEGGIEALEKRIKMYFLSGPFYINFLKKCFVYGDKIILERYIDENHLQNWAR